MTAASATAAAELLLPTRRGYVTGPSPLRPAPRLGQFLGIRDLWIKHDDELGFGGGGNKIRKLDYLVSGAHAAGADMLITTGAVQSNHCRLTAAAAAREALACRLLLEERTPGSSVDDVGNPLLVELFGVERVRVVPAGADLGAELARMAEEARGEGRRPYAINGGGSVPLGCVGYVVALFELLDQFDAIAGEPGCIVVASGSGGTHAGLLAGLAVASAPWQLTGVSVRRTAAEQEPMITELAARTLQLLGLPVSSAVRAVVRDTHVGPGYGLPSDDTLEAIRQTAHLEGVLLDPVYTGKAMAGLFAMAREGQVPDHGPVVFWHTGGAAALHAYADDLRRPDGVRA